MFPDYRNKKAVVIGLARSGVAAANLLNDLGAKVFVTDNADNPKVKSQASDLRAKGIDVETGGHTMDFIRGKDLVVISPGVPDESQALLWAKEFDLPVISEIELAWQQCPATIIAVTGSNGKTTVTTLIAEALKTKGARCFALGNIGLPFSACVRDTTSEDYVSLEASSFQLERVESFRPRVALITNFTQNHLDKNHRGYADISEYLRAKKRIFMNQGKDDYLVLNEDDPVLKSLSKEAKSKIVFFRAKTELNANQSAVMAVASIFGVNENSCREVFRNFKGVEHRFEFVRTIKGVRFINDSKATTTDSTRWALNSISSRAILIAGGQDKGLDYGVISDIVKEKVRVLILIGEAKEKIRKAFEGIIPIKVASSLEEAVDIGFKEARNGDAVLLSPMCASFDMFDDFEHRGREFKEIVNKLHDI